MDTKHNLPGRGSLIPTPRTAAAPEAGVPLVTPPGGQLGSATIRQVPVDNGGKVKLSRQEALQQIARGYGNPAGATQSLRQARRAAAAESGERRITSAEPAIAQASQTYQDYLKTLTTKALASEMAVHQALSQGPAPGLQDQIVQIEGEISDRIERDAASNDDVVRKFVNTADNIDMHGPELRHYLLPLVLERLRRGLEIGNLAKLFVVISPMPGDLEEYVAEEIKTNLKRAILHLPPEDPDAHRYMETNAATRASSTSLADALVTLQQHLPTLPVEDQNELRRLIELRQAQMENKLTGLIASSLATSPTNRDTVDAAMVGVERAKQAYSALLHMIDHPLKDDPKGAMEGLLRSRTGPQYHALVETFCIYQNVKREAAARGLRAAAMMPALPNVERADKKTQQDLDLYRLWEVVKTPDPSRRNLVSELFSQGLDVTFWATTPDIVVDCSSILSISAEIATRTSLSDKEMERYAQQLDNIMSKHNIGGENLGFIPLRSDVQKLKALAPQARPAAFCMLTEAACREAQDRIANEVQKTPRYKKQGGPRVAPLS